MQNMMQNQSGWNLNLSRRTRFFVKYAKEINPRVSALLFLLANYTRTRFKQGKRGESCAWHCTAKWLGEQLGLTTRSVYWLLHHPAVRQKIAFKRTVRGLLIWLIDQDVYAELRRSLEANDNFDMTGEWTVRVVKEKKTPDGEDRVEIKHRPGYYDVDVSRVLGINGGIIYLFLRDAMLNKNTRTWSPASIAKCLPWLNENSARYELRALYQSGYVERLNADQPCHLGNLGWRYRWSGRQIAENPPTYGSGTSAATTQGGETLKNDS